MNRSFAVAVVAAVVGAAAATIYFTQFAPGPTLVGCAGGPHCRDVVVGTVGGGAPQILPLADDRFTARGVMKWELDSATVAAGYFFPADGINFHPTPAKPSPHQAPPGVFDECKAMPQGSATPTKFQCKNNKTADGTWAYLVTVQKGSAKLTLDPYIINN